MTAVQMPWGILVKDVCDFDLSEILECGQCFRFLPDEDNVYHGAAGSHPLHIRQDKEELSLFGCSLREFETIWKPYFDLDTDYGALKTSLAKDPVMRTATQYASGIRILRQDPWEALASFILSQNNNIKRIMKIVTALCQCFGEQHGGFYAFPTAQALAGLAKDDLAPLRCGFRDEYLLDAARKVAGGEVDLEQIRRLPLEEAETMLRTIKGVGPKVAQCALLYGLHRIDAFPVDVWIARAMKTYYPNGLPEFMKPYAGIAQQYLFHYIRTAPEQQQTG